MPATLNVATPPGPDGHSVALLKIRARQFINAYPDIYGQAYEAASAILKKHTVASVQPDKVWWHRFDNAMSSRNTYTGWAHRGVPVESMTLVELVMHRFAADDQDSTDNLHMLSGFYTDGPEHGVYDFLNQVALLPGEVLADFWALDFSAAFRLKVQQFWGANSETFRLLAKARFLAAAGLARAGGTLLEADFQTVIRCVAAQLPEVMTLELLEERVEPSAGISPRSFDIGEYVAHDIVRIVDDQGRQILYLPGQTPAFRAFGSDAELGDWVKGQCATAADRTRFTLHFFASQVAKEEDGGVFDSWIGQLQRGEWSERRVINRIDSSLTSDLFDHLGQQAREHMMGQAHLLLTSNGSLRKQMLLGYLNAFVHIVGVFTPLCWPMTLVAVGAGVACVGLNIDQAANGNSARLRKAGVIGAIFDSLSVLFNLPVLSFLRETSDLTTTLAASAADPFLSEWAGSVTLASELEVASTEQMQGIHQLANGETWISLQGRSHRVRYSAALRIWTVVDPDNPFAFNGAIPVRFNVQGQWQVVPRLRLQGGTPMEAAAGPSLPSTVQGHPFVTIGSPFWDIYTRFELAEEMRLSSVALLRQQHVIDVKAFEEGDQVMTDAGGNELLTDRWGNEYRVFRRANGTYSGGRIFDYTASDVAFNHYLRTGEQTSPEQVSMIEELAADLDSVGRDNEVALFRGGCGARNTSGLTFRNGQIRAGDLLVNTDFTSFTENPYIVRVFSSSQGGVQSALFNGEITFDETSVVFELPVRSYMSATPVAQLSSDWEEAESIFKPGAFFQIDTIDEVKGDHYALIRVQMHEVQPGQPGRIFDMRTGELFSRESYANRLGAAGAALVDLFFAL